jgi:hypothetical protein
MKSPKEVWIHVAKQAAENLVRNKVDMDLVMSQYMTWKKDLEILGDDYPDKKPKKALDMIVLLTHSDVGMIFGSPFHQEESIQFLINQAHFMLEKETKTLYKEILLSQLSFTLMIQGWKDKDQPDFETLVNDLNQNKPYTILHQTTQEGERVGFRFQDGKEGYTQSFYREPDK